MDDEDLGRIMSSLTTAIVDARNRAAQIAIDVDFREIVKHAREMHDTLTQAMRDAPEMVNDELRAYCNEATSKSASWRSSAVVLRARWRIEAITPGVVDRQPISRRKSLAGS